MRFLFSISILAFYSLLAFGQVADQEVSKNEENLIAVTTKTESHNFSQFKHVILVNYIPLIGLFSNSPGLGLGYQFNLNPHFSFGPNLYYSRIHSFTRIYPHQMTLQFINAGVEARYKISSFAKDGFYAGAGLISSGVQGSVEIKSIFGGRPEKAETSYQWETVVVPRVGYMWVPSEKDTGYADSSLSYEPLDKVDYFYQWGDAKNRPAYMEIKKRKLGVNVTFLIGYAFK